MGIPSTKSSWTLSPHIHIAQVGFLGASYATFDQGSLGKFGQGSFGDNKGKTFFGSRGL